MKPQTEAKLTKRQQKALRGPNAAVQRSINQGSEIKRAGVTYKGRNPEYNEFGKKSRPGIPFVRASQKRAA